MEYLNNIQKAAPIISIKSCFGKEMNIKKGMVITNNGEWNNDDVPYIKQLNAYIQDYRRMTRNDRLPKVIFLVSDNFKIVCKNAAYLSYLYRSGIEENNDYDYDSLYFDEEDEGTINVDCYIVDYENLSVPEGVQQVKYIFPLLDINNEDCVLFTGLNNDNNTYKKVESIMACEAAFKIIHISESQRGLPWVLDMQISNNAVLWKFKDNYDEYYKQFTINLLKDKGYELDKSLTCEMLINAIKKKTADNICEESVAWFVYKAVINKLKNNSCDNALDEISNEQQNFERNDKKILSIKDFKELEISAGDGFKKLKKLTGLKEMKDTIAEYVAVNREALVNKKLGNVHSNMIFYGNPGTGKTTGAGLLAQILAENGVSNSRFCVCSRKDLIGKYVGHTAHMVAQKFEQAKGGVLFVDEAGFFLNENSGGYVNEAMKEFIRYMEMYPDITVIFAMYESEVEDFLKLDDGLVSRISRMVHFKDYSIDELWCIAKDMLNEKGYILDKSGKELFEQYMSKLMQKNNFGNARDVRKLIETCIIAVSIRHAAAKNKKDKQDRTINVTDMKNAIDRLDCDIHKNARAIGFAISDNKGGCYAYK